MRILFGKLMLVLSGLCMLAGCVSHAPYDYTAFRASRPASILILPPINHSLEVNASYSVLAQLSRPLGEAGYYVLPVGLVDEAFKNNGLASPDEIHRVPPAKLREIFGADAALYVTVADYGTSYRVISSDTSVTLAAQLIDLRTGSLLWQGTAYASTAEERNQSGGLLAMLIGAIVNQVADSVSEYGHQIAGRADERLLDPHRFNGILPGPRSPTYAEALATP